jgi:hypothetical protein
MATTTDDLLRDLIKELRKGGGPGGPRTPSGPSSGDKDPYADVESKTSDFGKKLVSASDTVKGAWDKVSKDVESSQGMWQKLSSSGMNFSGDLFALRNSAIGMRMSQEEMSQSFAQFAKEGTLVGFGSNLTRSAEGFAKASKQFFDENSTLTDSLGKLGYTTKDINDLMAVQGVTLRGKFKNDQEMYRIAAEQAAKMGQEMDLMAKLTGKSREEQLEQQKKNSQDMQFEAAIRLKTQGMNATEAAAFEKNARSQLLQAQLLGQGDAFKQVFATGTVYLKDTARNASINQEQFQAVANAAKASADRTITQTEREERAAKAQEDLRVAAVKDANDTSKLNLRILGDLSDVSKSSNEMAGAQNVYVRNVEKAAAELGVSKTDPEAIRRAVKMTEEEAKKAADGKNKEGKAVDQTSVALTELQARTKDVGNSLNDQLVIPLQNSIRPALSEFSDAVTRAKGNLAGITGLPANTRNQTVYQQSAEELAKGKETSKPTNATQAVGTIVGGIQQGVNWLVDKIPKRSTGSIGAAGNLFENFGPGTLVELHGMESVMRPKDLEDIMKNATAGMMKATPATGILSLEALGHKMNTQVSSKEMTSAFSAMSKSNLDYISKGLPTNSATSFKGENDRIAEEFKRKTTEAENKFRQIGSTQGPEAEAKARQQFMKETSEQTSKKDSDKISSDTTKKSASLSDVVDSLNMLNKQMGQLLAAHTDIGNKQIRAVKSNSRNLFER